MIKKKDTATHYASLGEGHLPWPEKVTVATKLVHQSFDQSRPKTVVDLLKEDCRAEPNCRLVYTNLPKSFARRYTMSDFVMLSLTCSEPMLLASVLSYGSIRMTVELEWDYPARNANIYNAAWASLGYTENQPRFALRIGQLVNRFEKQIVAFNTEMTSRKNWYNDDFGRRVLALAKKIRTAYESL
jgi:hypothetical protein